jgi:UDP-2,3-diacylglucosamine pyrophosphatase LpxH
LPAEAQTPTVGLREQEAAVVVTESDAAEKEHKYRQRIKDGLDATFDDRDTSETELAIDRDRLVIFSDHHRGARDGADDFWRCERSYHAALGYYLEHGYRLALLGDVEELWENKPQDPMQAYQRTLELEREFHDQGRLVRCWGNHDDAWRHEGEVKKHLRPHFPDLVVREALKLRVAEAGQRLGLIFLVHGHQGTLDSDRLSAFSRLPVRHLWRPIQRRFKIPSTTPARDFKLRALHDDAMFKWALGRTDAKPILISGHTHRPVFSTPESTPERPPDAVATALRQLREHGGTRDQLADLRAELELVRTPPFGEPPKEMPVPCYFNTGCCSFGDGDVTGLELADTEIRLVRWLNDEYEPRRKRLAEPRKLRDVFAEVHAARPELA